ncbi:YciI family protein [Neotabrizicola shimadae]|uniref:YciI family protein n=1 Tax=Neotabrizicola shimadae TaxID=2807096 RepID=A0A8G1EAM1_9RHOB|nr:YciI family protein [Neotabrizicola shimadae]QYZ68740.1 YciI family protein [Neotabrizicola shimadae]
MKYLCTVIVDNDIAAAVTPEGWAKIGEESQAYDRALMARGVFLAAEALHGRETARTVRVRGGDALVTDGPYAESKEVLAGFILIDVADAEAAMEVARNIPMARLGAVEVRPVMDFE